MSTPFPYWSLVGVIGLSISSLSACSETGSSDPGSVAIHAESSGGDLDADGYTVSIDAGTSVPIAANGSIVVNGLTAGSHHLAVAGIASNCALAGQNPVPVAVMPGQTTTVTIAVSCTSTHGTLRVTVQSTAPNQQSADADGFVLRISGQADRSIPVNADVSVPGLEPGQYPVSLIGVQPNCAVDGPADRTATIAAGATAEVAYQVACTELFHPAGIIQERQTIAGGPYGVAAAANGAIYAALIGSTDLIRGNLAQFHFDDRVTVGSTPPHVVIDRAGTTAYATLQTGQGLVAVNATTNQVIGTAPLSSDGFNLTLSPSASRVYATTAQGTLHVFTAPQLEPITTLQVGGAANGLVFRPDGLRLYVTARDAGTVVEIDAETNAILRTIPLGGRPQRIAVAPDASELYIANEDLGLQVVSLPGGQVTSLSMPSGSVPYGIGVSPDGARIYLLLALLGEVRILDRASKALITTVTVGGVARNIAFSADGRYALVTNEAEVVFVR
jgi:YVTN family beta-propeller protein